MLSSEGLEQVVHRASQIRLLLLLLLGLLLLLLLLVDIVDSITDCWRVVSSLHLCGCYSPTILRVFSSEAASCSAAPYSRACLYGAS